MRLLAAGRTAVGTPPPRAQSVRPHGFNVGLNLGAAAGGSLAEHLHQHIVPRWGGDANFITVIGGAKVMPQLLRDTRALLASAWNE